MAGDIWLSKEERFPTNFSMYNWVLDFLIVNIKKPQALKKLKEIRDANLGLVNLEDFDLPVQSQILELLSDKLVTDAQTRLPSNMPERQSYVNGLERLSTMASRKISK